jgi:hypothetical protein
LTGEPMSGAAEHTLHQAQAPVLEIDHALAAFNRQPVEEQDAATVRQQAVRV